MKWIAKGKQINNKNNNLIYLILEIKYYFAQNSIIKAKKICNEMKKNELFTKDVLLIIINESIECKQCLVLLLEMLENMFINKKDNKMSDINITILKHIIERIKCMRMNGQKDKELGKY